MNQSYGLSYDETFFLKYQKHSDPFSLPTTTFKLTSLISLPINRDHPPLNKNK